MTGLKISGYIVFELKTDLLPTFVSLQWPVISVSMGWDADIWEERMAFHSVQVTHY